jgi:hypothetical protein
LTASQQVEIHYRSRGCFHEIDQSFAFKRTPRGMEVRIGPNKALRDPDRSLFTRSLTAEEIADVDEELDFHRSSMPTLCTTLDEFELRFSDQGKPLRTEHFVDGSCSAPLQKPRRTTLYTLSNLALGRQVRNPDSVK